MTGVLKSIHRIAVIFLVASFGFMVAAVVAFNTGFQPWADGHLLMELRAGDCALRAPGRAARRPFPHASHRLPAADAAMTRTAPATSDRASRLRRSLKRLGYELCRSGVYLTP